jgi:hypothetical protein
MLDKTNGSTYFSMFEMLNAWQFEADKLKRGEITKEEYNDWRYNDPRIEAERIKTQLDARRAERNAEPIE